MPMGLSVEGRPNDEDALGFEYEIESEVEARGAANLSEHGTLPIHCLPSEGPLPRRLLRLLESPYLSSETAIRGPSSLKLMTRCSGWYPLEPPLLASGGCCRRSFTVALSHHLVRG